MAAAASGLPAWLARLLAQPTLLLGTAFMVLVVLAPNGFGARFRGDRTVDYHQTSEEAVRDS